MPKYNLPSAWNAGYAIPDYVNAEPPQQGTMTTAWLPRGTISEVLPPLMAEPEPLGSLSGSSLAGSVLSVPTLVGQTLQGDSLGVQARRQAQPLGADPVRGYGANAAAWIMKRIARVPQPQRKVAMRALLDAVDPTLWGEVDRLGEQLRQQGVPAARALEQALAQAMAKGVVGELREIGQRALRGDRSPVKARSQLGLGVYPQQCACAQRDALQQLGFSLSDLNPVSAVQRAASAVASAAGAVARGTRNAAGAVWDGTKWVGGQISAGTQAAANFVTDGVKRLGSLACNLANSSAGSLAASAGGAAGAAGAAAVQGMCGGAKASASPYAAASPAAPASGTPAWLLPAGIAAAGLGLILVLK